MTALARPKSVALVAPAFGRPRDDRAPLCFAAGLAVAIHFLAILIPLPDKPQPALLPPSVQASSPNHVPLPPPALPERPEPPVQRIDRESPPLPVPLEVPEQLPFIEHTSVPVEPVDIPVVPIDLELGDIVPPVAVPELVEPGEPGLVLPVAIYRPDPDYPELAIRTRQSGRVVLRAVIDNGGSVGDIEVLLSPVPDLGFRAAAIEAVRQWRYQPGELRGRTVSVRMTVVVDFSLN